MEKKRLILPLVFLMVVTLIIGTVSFFRVKYDSTPTLSILMLHMVTKEMPEDRGLDTLYITDKMLEEYCKYFKGKYEIVDLVDAYDIMKNNKKVSNNKLMAFTFDDGYDNNYDLAYPILLRNDVKSNINIIAKYSDEKRKGYLNWDEIKEMSDSGLINIGSHTYDSHYYKKSKFGDERPMLSTYLPGEDDAKRKNRIFTDLEKADKMISNAINKDLTVLAYPYGVPPKDLVNEIGDKFNYNIQLMVRPGVNKKIEDFNKLKRFAVNGRETPEELDRMIERYTGTNFLNMFKNGELF